METPSIEVALNGERRQVARGATLTQLLGELGLDPRRVAVEINRELAPRESHAQRVLQAGDCLEVVTLVGGG